MLVDGALAREPLSVKILAAWYARSNVDSADAIVEPLLGLAVLLWLVCSYALH